MKIKFFPTLFSLCLFFGVTGCSVPIKEAQKADCGPWLFGIAKASSEEKQFSPSLWAETHRSTCLQTNYAQGFNEFDPEQDAVFTYRSIEADIARKPTRAAPILSNSSAPLQTKLAIQAIDHSTASHTESFKFSASSATHQFEFTSSSPWELATSPSPLYQLFAKNRTTKAALFISMYDVNPFLIWSDSRDSMYMRMRDTLAYFDATQIKEITLNGLNAFQTEYRGRDKDGVPLHFLSTQIRMNDKLIYLTNWCFEDDYVKNETEFHAIVHSLAAKTRF